MKIEVKQINWFVMNNKKKVAVVLQEAYEIFERLINNEKYIKK